MLNLLPNGNEAVQTEGSFPRLTAGDVRLTKWRNIARWAGSIWDYDRVELAFATIELRGICESRRRATTALGFDAARELEQRLADLSALATVRDLFDLFADDIIDRSPSERSVRLRAGYDLVFCAGHVDVPLAEDGSPDWTKVSRIRILALEAHDG